MKESKICRFCGNIISKDAQKCKFCGKKLVIKETPDMFCKKCKAPVNIDDNFCERCGAIFNIPEPIKPPKHNLSGIPYHLGILLTSVAASFALTVLFSVGKDMNLINISIIACVAFIISEILFYIYFLPSIIAIEKNHSNTLLIYICNLLLGITIIGWFVTLIIAMQSDENA